MQGPSSSLPLLLTEQLHLGGGHGGTGGSALFEGGKGGVGQGASVNLNVFAETAMLGHSASRIPVAKKSTEEVVDVSCPPGSPYFEGRQDELAQLGNFFGKTSIDRQIVVLLHGLGGIGKTQIALKFIHDAGHR
uniref:NB-ARC domain-containing protein n=1 Tax=Mycena chlorophos TaxID=658473 RepID=A0ABQ0M953_MYCCL|nr:predicted protein [Mycena chlorophos]